MKIIREKIKLGDIELVGFERTQPITEIVLHSTAGEGTLKYFRSGARKNSYLKKEDLFHYIIEMDGRVVQIIEDNQWVFHSSSRYHDKKTIGIEIIKLRSNKDMIQSVQYRSLNNLIDHLCSLYPIKTIATHDYNAWAFKDKLRKTCPGNIDFEQITSIERNHLKLLSLLYGDRDEDFQSNNSLKNRS